MEPFTLVYLFIIIVLSTFIDYLIFSHFNTLFEAQFNQMSKLINIVAENKNQDLNGFDITGNEFMQRCEEE